MQSRRVSWPIHGRIASSSLSFARCWYVRAKTSWKTSSESSGRSRNACEQMAKT